MANIPCENRIRPKQSRGWIMLLIAWLPATVAQAADLHGSVTGYDDSVVSEVPIQVTNEATEAFWRTFSNADGSYLFDQLPPGSYSLFVNTPCCALSKLNENNIELGADGRVFNVVLKIGAGLGAFGDDPQTLMEIMLNRRGELPDLNVPRIDDRPDLSGFWLYVPNPFPDQPDPKPWAAELVAERRANSFVDSPGLKCLPNRPNGPLGWGRYVQASDRLIMLSEGTPNVRQIFLDGRDHPADPDPTWQGHSIGRWEGDTLVVDTIGYNGRGWNFGFPISEQLRVTETFKRVEYGRMEYAAIFDDPEVFETPWTQRHTLELAPKEDVMETICENNRW
jgi:hypothetical protein